ncbi:MAG: tetratricopeptide repeat protein [Nitrospirae bacterium]|nr:tetratricopeptide repeat protein [Nitrospirota bacterium]
MAYKIRVVTRKQQLKKPDEFISAVDWLGEKIREQAKLLWAVLAVVLVIGAGIGAYVFHQQQQEARAAALAFQGLQYYRQQVPGGELGAALSKEENYKKAVEQFEKVLQDFPQTPTAPIAQYYLGNAYLELKDFESAAAAYRAFLEKNPKNDILAGLTYQRLGYVFLAKDSFQEASLAFESIDRLAGALNKDEADYELGRLDETLGKKEEAITRYQEIVNRFPESLFLAEAQKRLSALGVADVKPVPLSQEKPAPVEVPAPTEKK